MYKGLTGPVDVHIGAKLKQLRMSKGMSLQALAEELDVSFQQIQKYENVHNRISVSTLYRISQILSVPLDFFFEGLGEKYPMPENEMARIQRSVRMKETSEFLHSFQAISSRRARRQIITFLEFYIKYGT